MPEDRTGRKDPFQQWRELSRAFLEGGEADGPLRARCEELFAAWGRFANAWAEAAGAAAGQAPGQPGGPFDPTAWLDAGGAGGWGDLWRWFGDTDSAEVWGAERDLLRASTEWYAYAAALERYNAVMARAWMKAFGRFAEGMADEVGDGTGDKPDWAATQARWQAAADAELAEAQRSEAFLDAQRELLRARLACAKLLRSRVEGLARLLGLPTRTEIDGLHETLHLIRRELRLLRADLAAAKRDPDG